ncbi:Putative GTP-ase activating protein for Arf [Babesia bigemina]|uniref:Putative GTP-ase activating protein for Arf n=1 Tax=Babesia bigemina TaxID=5866 RepID=A0A061DAK6_BABBI|nr:Putative GTP-ase activating protein for Arf [Babesia bigemina]CDR94750.1 Putative GTP-ase activating protein for Arf [Babesia bigemina]|eukprot:XP_012766936.1 Putative GTP-ase activating protein for Arf [Babesia bigemina]
MDTIAKLQVDARGYVTDEARDKVFRQLLAQTENAVCIDCNARNPTWVSLTYAVHLCLNCSGKHRQFGSHISFVRSADMDKFTREQLIRIAHGGNARAKTYFRQIGLTRQPYDYASPMAQRYPAMLDAELGTVREQAPERSFSQKQPSSDLLDLGNDDAAPKRVEQTGTMSSGLTSNATAAPRASTGIGSMTLGRGSSDATRSWGTRTGSGGHGAGFGGRVDLDFDAFERSIISEAAQKKNLIATRTTEPTPQAREQTPLVTFAPPTSSPQQYAPPPDMSRFAGKTGISSDQVFGRGAYAQHAPMNVTLNPHKTSLSSDEYFGRPPKSRGNSETFEERAVQNIKEGIAIALKEGNRLVGMAKQWFSSHQH